ncbi:MAG: ABC-type bacteriocin/lantibiotic exporter with double-glycine peptidase domain [Patiriisocius sp.]|jgi:ABC-type bacteriocin/lantibiotic exporter with double-glycine peptidase domain
MKNKHSKYFIFYSFIRQFFDKEIKTKLLLSLGVSIVRILLSILWPVLLYKSIFKDGALNMETIEYNLPIAIALFGLSQLLAYKQATLNIHINNKISIQTYLLLSKKLYSLEWLTYKKQKRVYYFDVFVTSFYRVRQGINSVLEIVIPHTIISLVMVFFIAYINFHLFILFLVTYILIFVFQWISYKKLGPLTQMFHNSWRKQDVNISATIDKYNLVKMGRGFDQATSDFKEKTWGFLEDNSAIMKARAKSRIVNQVTNQISKITLLVVGGFWVNSGVVSLSEFIFTFFIASVVQSSISQLPGGVMSLLDASASTNKLVDFLNLKSEDKVPSSKHVKVNQIDEIKLRNICFSYGEENSLLDNIDVQLHKGRIYLLSGKNGSGKTTLSSVLLGLIKPKKGDYYVNKQKTPWESVGALRDRFAYINQETILFAGTIEKNITFGHENKQRPVDKLQTTWLSTLLSKGISNLDKTIFENNEGVSGGEAKKLVLIRELLHNSELIVFDEPFNHLDKKSIAILMNQIKELKKDKIILLISHQTGFEEIADEMIKLD